MKQSFEPLEVLDWYDGIVVGVVRIGGGGSLFLAALLCWAQERRLRVYALLEIERADVDRLSAPDAHLPRVKTEVERCFAEADREISITCVDEATDTVVAEKRVPQPTCWGTLSPTLSKHWAPTALAGSTRSFPSEACDSAYDD